MKICKECKNIATDKIVIFRESLWQSIAINITDFGFLLGSVWFNYKFIGNSKMVNFIIFILFWMMVFAKANGKTTRFTDKKKAIKYIEE